MSDLLKTLNLVINPGSPSALETPSLYTLRSRYILPLKPLDFGTLYPLKALVNMWGSFIPIKVGPTSLLDHWKPWNIETLENYETLRSLNLGTLDLRDH